jgi:hypothetical protein
MDADKNDVGYIRCRFQRGTENLGSIGRYLGKSHKAAFQPYFVIYRDGNRGSATQQHITPHIIRQMVTQAMFEPAMIEVPEGSKQDQIHIELCLRGRDSLAEEFYPISGFPRALPGDADAHRPGNYENYCLCF